MTEKISRPYLLLIFSIPALMLLTAVYLGLGLQKFGQDAQLMSRAITIDLILTTPLVYFLLIRKKSIPKFTVVPFFIGGIVIASIILPPSYQDLLSVVKIWVLPMVELIIFSLVLRKIIHLRREFKSLRSERLDFLTALRQSTKALLPPRIASIFTMEIGLFYFTFFHWKKAVYRPNEFSYHKKTGILGVLAVLLLVATIELFSVHLLLHHSYPTLAWVLSIISLYGLIQLIGLMKSIPHTPIQIGADAVTIRMGLFQEAVIPFEALDSVELTMADYPKEDSSYQKITPFDHNCIIHLKTDQTLLSFFGVKKSFRHLVLAVDDLTGFKAALESEI